MGKLERMVEKVPDEEREKMSIDDIKQLKWVASLGTNLGEEAVLKLIPDNKKGSLTADELYKILSEKTGQDQDEERVASYIEELLKSINPKCEYPKLIINNMRYRCELDDKNNLVVPKEQIADKGIVAKVKSDPAMKICYFEVTVDKISYV